MLLDYFPKFHYSFLNLMQLKYTGGTKCGVSKNMNRVLTPTVLPKIVYDFSKYCLQVLLSDKRSKPISWRLKESYSCIFSLPLTFIAIQGRLVASWVWGWYSLRLAAHAGKAFNRYVERKWKLCTHSTE